MKYEEIIRLLDAGFTKEEIQGIANQINSQSGVVDPADPAKPAEPAEPAEPENDFTVFKNEFTEMMKTGFEEIKKEIIASNILNSQRDLEKNEPEDIIANIINPDIKENK